MAGHRGSLPLATRRRREVEDVEHPAGGGAALFGGVVGRAELAQRQVDVGREQQHEQRGPELEVTGQQPQPDLHGDHRDREARGQLEHERGEERDP